MRRKIRRFRGYYNLAQTCPRQAVNGKDELPIPQKVQLDSEYLERRSLVFDLKILWMTALKVLARGGVSH